MIEVPERAYVARPDDPCSIVAVKRGVKGYWVTDFTPEQADRFNGELGVTPSMRDAMGFASAVGWSTFLANPDGYLSIFEHSTTLTVGAMNPIAFGAPVLHA